MRPDGPNGSMSMGQKKAKPIPCVESLMKRRPNMNRAKHWKKLEEHLKDRGLFTMNNLSTTFRIPKRRALQGNNLGYKERRQDLTTIKAPIPPHIKVRIIDPSLAF